VALEQPGDERGGETHEGDRQDEAEDEHPGVVRGPPATASTLSSDMDTSATTICQAAWAKVLRGRARGAVPSSAASRRILLGVRVRSSRHIFQHTHRSRTPPASSRPHDLESWVVSAANTMRSTVAATIPIRIALLRWSFGRPARGEADHDGVVPASTRSIMMTCRKAS
jgi:hypothetical protein